MTTEIRPTPETDALHAKQGRTHASYRDFARKLASELASAKSLNKTLLDQLEAKDAQIEAMREEREQWRMSSVCREKDAQLKAMREAIKEVWIEIQYAESGFAGLALRVCPNDSAVESVLNHMTEALAKLQPFLND